MVRDAAFRREAKKAALSVPSSAPDRRGRARRERSLRKH
ncbi:hypothetical protein I552_6277 [Mycobacterium xenopi 3993]|nr:hypothetical protein I552_6277 [Mycobacterium xenopi 3993]